MAKDDSGVCDVMTDLLGMIATVSGWERERDWECEVCEWMKLLGAWMNEKMNKHMDMHAILYN